MSLDANELTRLARAIRAAAIGAGKIIGDAAASASTLVWENKGPADFVSKVDRDAETHIADLLDREFPSARIIGEEFSPAAEVSNELAFIIDPLDGTTNFLHGFPHYAVSIGATFGGEIVSGAILNVPTGELFLATAGRGATRNGDTIRASSETQSQRALIGTGFPFKEVDHLPLFLRQFDLVTRGTAGMRRAGSAALDLADTACGRFDAFWELGLAPWDVAAGLLIVREAGGVATHMDGSPAKPVFGSFLAGGPAMHAWLLKTLREAERGA